MSAAVEAWRLFAHWSPLHALANAAAIAVLGAMVAWRERPAALVRVLAVAFAVQALVLLAMTDVDYRGASGFVFALATYALARAAEGRPRTAAFVALCGAAYMIAVAAGWVASRVLPEGVAASGTMHVAGAVAGLLAALPWLRAPERAASAAVQPATATATPGDHCMGIFSSIIDKFRNLGTKDIEGVRPTDAVLKQRGEMPAQAPAAPAPSSAPLQNVDIDAVLKGLAAKKGGGGNYKTSIVDLLKLLDLDSSLDARKELAAELGVNAGAHGTAEQNIALHKAVMRKVAENGGKVPDSMKD